MADEEKQQAYVEMQVLDQQLKQLQEYLENFETQMVNITEILSSFDEFEKVPNEANILVPLHNGIFVEAKLGKAKTLRINVGSNTIVAKDLSEARELMKKQAEAVELYKAETLAQINTFTARLQELQESTQEK